LKCDDKESPRAKPFEPESPNVIVCEGFHDMAFVCSLLNHLKITNCDVTYPKKSDGGNGKSGIKNVVALLAGREGIAGVLIVTDADIDAEASFKDMKDAFCKPFDAPPKAFIIHRTKKHKTGIFLTPGAGKTGALESLLLEAVKLQHPDAINCIDALEKCTNSTAGWSDNKRSKMRLACYIACHCKNDPCCSPGFIWSEKNVVIDIASPAFTELCNLLQEFSKDPEA
jgi:hypothetical protein